MHPLVLGDAYVGPARDPAVRLPLWEIDVAEDRRPAAGHRRQRRQGSVRAEPVKPGETLRGRI